MNDYSFYVSSLEKIFDFSISEYPECLELIEHYEKISLEDMTDDEIYQEICWIVYSSGFNNDVVRKYWPNISHAYYNFDIQKVASEYYDIESSANIVCQKSSFNNRNKAKWCIYNAHRIIQINDITGFKELLSSLFVLEDENIYFKINEVKDNLGLKGIGDITIYHLLKNIGMNIFKPDVHVSKILDFLGISNKLMSKEGVYKIFKQVSVDIGIDVSTLDTALFVFGKNNRTNITKKLNNIIL